MHLKGQIKNDIQINVIKYCAQMLAEKVKKLLPQQIKKKKPWVVLGYSDLIKGGLGLKSLNASKAEQVSTAQMCVSYSDWSSGLAS